MLLTRCHRRFVGARVRWVAITGSTGKTTASTLVAGVLDRRGPLADWTVVSTSNSMRFLCRAILSTGRRHRYGVVEVGVGDPGDMALKMEALRPNIGIVTTIGSDHRKIFRTLDNTALEKSEVVRRLSAEGVAILNTDDPRVWAMREVTGARVIGCGRSPDATLRLEAVSAVWPDRLSLSLRIDGRRVSVPTRFVGSYAAFPVMSALAVGMAEGIPIQESIDAIGKVEPVDGRMCPHSTSDGIVFIDNGWKTPYHIVPTTLEFLREARAARKIIVFGEISDYANNTGRCYRSIARAALEVADVVIFSGPWALSVTKVASPKNRLLAFDSTLATRNALKSLLQKGDLVVLQGSQRMDHFERIIFDRTRRVDCWTNKCKRMLRCRECELLAGGAPA